MGKDVADGNPKDTIVIFLGPTGSGKTNFINTFTGGAEKPGAGSLKPDTQSVTPYTITYPNHRLVLIDTLGFDDASRPDGKVLADVAKWLKQKYPDSAKLEACGIIYLHRITDNRMSGSVYKNLQTFSRLWGNIPLRRTCLVTTMWDKANPKDSTLALAKDREKQLKDDFWKKLLDEGTVARQFDNTQRCAWDIVCELVGLGEGGSLDRQEFVNEMGESANCFRAVFSAMKANT